MSVVQVPTLQLRIGDQWNFQVAVTDKETGDAIAIGSQYTEAKLVLRAAWNESLDELLLADETSGLTIDNAGGTVTASIGATATKAIPAISNPRNVACLLRLYDPSDDDVTQSFAIPFELFPDLLP